MRINKQLKNISWYFCGTVITALLGFISTPLLTRVLSTEVYAQYGMAITFTTLLSTFIYFGQDEAFMRYFNRRDKSIYRFIFQCIRFPLIICAIVIVTLLEPSQTIIKWIFESNINIYTSYLIGFYIIILILQRFLMLSARMEERAFNYSLSNVTTKAVFIIAIFILLWEFGEISFNGIIVALICGVVMAGGINIFAIIKSKHVAKLSIDSVTSKEMLSFGLPFAFSSTLIYVVPLVEKLIIMKITNWDVLAIYTGAAIFITVMGLVKTTVNNIWIPYAYKNYTQDESFKKVFHNIGISLALLMLYMLGATILLRRWIVLILAEDYFNSFIIAPAILFGACFDVLASVYTIGINLKKKTAYLPIIPVVQMMVSLMLLIFLLPKLGLLATGISYLISIVVSRSVQIMIAFHYFGTGESEKKLGLLLFIGIVASIMSLFFTSLTFDVISAVIIFTIGFFVTAKEIKAVLKLGLSR